MQQHTEKILKEIIIKKTPYRKRQIISISLLFLAGMIFAVSIVLEKEIRQISPILLFLLKHGSEGGMVGGLCDWFAVWKTYNAIETDSQDVADEIGNWVSTDLLNQHTLRQQLSQILEDQEMQKQIIGLIETYFDTESNTRAILERVLSKVEKPLTEFITNYNFSNAEIRLISDTTSDKTIVNTIKICIGDTLVHMAEEARFKELLNRFIREQNILTKFLSNFINIPEIIRSYGEKLKRGESAASEEESYLDEVVTVISLSADKYILSWQNLSAEQKTDAVEALVFKLKEAFLDITVKFIMEHKDYLKSQRTLSEYEPVREVFHLIESRIDENVSHFIGEKISARLKSQDPKDFRERLEWQTRNVLESIRINGTILGFALGALIGTVHFFIH